MTGRKKWVASLPFSTGDSFAGRLAMLGGSLVLDDTQITFKPIAGLGRSRKIALTDIESVTAFGEQPPRLRITLKKKEALVFIVVPSRTTLVSSNDTSARDEAVASIGARLAHR